jgi:SIR2-like domain
MMPQWASLLVDALGARARQVRITPDMPGPDFEAALGQFLSFAKALPIIEKFGYLGNTPNPQVQVSLKPGQDFNNWVNYATNSVNEIMNGLHANLYTCFGLGSVDVERAKMAYQALHHEGLGWAPESTRIIHATTNFDPALEVAIDEDDDLDYVDGFTRPPGGGTRVYSPELIQAAVASDKNFNRIPILHLHGAVGWYYNSDNNITKDASDLPFVHGRNPALLLPDDTKNPANFQTGLDATWTIFQSIMPDVTHVLVLGHSLNDKHIVEALRQWRGSIAVVLFRRGLNPAGEYQPASKEEKRAYSRLLQREVTLIPGRFGQAADHDDFDLAAMRTWTSG